ncbi:VWA domain containing CoxE-like protein [Sphingomonas sp. NFR04]|uniref:VWA domain-containing protein n=1 Tax=Sphingomonas sp. NFR04 TaxID=1566283 RepID=UPI0008F271BD|nr:VWA domain-containing protein [Sphingomonas sp. NFR04]SFJ65594.1 VWA domain containing CoxE-like protein [Sphingomonas sp. NFR04]
MSGDAPHLKRWRMVLGRYADPALDRPALDGPERRMDRALDYLYARELTQRGLKQHKPAFGSLDPSRLSALDWIGEVRELFPQSVLEMLQSHAVDRLGLTELLSDPKTLEALEPNRDLLKALVAFKGRASPAVQDKIREVARKVVEDTIRRLRPSIDRAFSGRRNRFRRSQTKRLQDFDWRATIRDNLRNYDPERKRIIADRLRFTGRARRQLPWTIILCVDQSGSMLGSVIYAAVMAAILAALPSVAVRLIVFDTSVVDLTSEVADPVSVLMSVQLGGGTDIGRAVHYCEQQITQPSRTIFVLLSDFCEGGPVAPMVAAVRRMASARVTLIGLAALDDQAAPDYDRATAKLLANAGMKIAALTPDRFAEWIAGIIE